MNTKSRLLTFLFTDIEGSTRRWEADADTMRVALEKHNAVLRDAVEANDGRVFNYTGDGMCAVFASPRSAVDTAIAAQLALELPVRMGIATGEAELRGGDYFGTVLNRAARVMAAGHGGQILIDGATAALISGVNLISLGPRRLRDIANPVDVFQVQSDGIRAEFPPLNTVDPAPGNLRARSTTFVGREAELVELEEALKAHQLVTLTGVGGVGKTRLALEVGARLVDSFRDGVWVIELAAVGDPAAVPDAVAAVLGITQQPGMTLADSVAAGLEGRSRLLIFDNCEHVLDAAADLIEAIVARSDTVKILATSREGLRVTDEQLWPVPPLDVRTGADSAAATLFTHRAQAVSPDVSLTVPEQATAVVEICGQLDGIPLAIELAASRMVSMTAMEVRDRLGDRFRLLVGSRRGLGRHQTLRHAVQWSYDLLDDVEKSLLAACSVFAGGFDLAAASVVTGSTDEFATLDLVDALVRKSLLVADRSSGSTRFSMLETIRQFAEEQLVSTGHVDEVRATHARYFASLEPTVLARWDSARQRETYLWFALELANLRAAFRWGADHDELDTATAIAVYASFLGVAVDQYEPVGWAEELIEPASAVDHPRLAHLYVMASQCYAAGRLDEAAIYVESAQLAMDGGRFVELPSDFEASLGGVYVAQGRPEQWISLCHKMIARGQGTHSFARLSLVLALLLAGADDAAIEASDVLIHTPDSSDNPRLSSFALFAYGIARRDTDPVVAYDVLRRALRIAQASGNRQNESYLAVSLSRLAVTHSEPVDAFDYLTLAIRNRYDAGSFRLLDSPLAILAALLHQLEHHEPAATISGFALTPQTKNSYPEFTNAITDLRMVLGDGIYESLANKGAAMTNAAMAKYALEQIDLARADLVLLGKAP